MTKPIGEIIRTLRKERNLTQEELAALLNVTGQAISKWENGTSMPDISQIVPLASTFGVPTDVLFDTVGKSDDDRVLEILETADKNVHDENGLVSTGSLYEAYMVGQEALKRYPSNVILLLYCLEKGIALAYPENNTYDTVHAAEIYKECVREAALVITYGKNVTDILRAHMIMVLLHAAYGDYDKAKAHAEQFPWRADMTVHEMTAYIAHAAGEYAAESRHCQIDTMYHLEAILDDVTQNGCAYLALEKYADALTCFQSVFALIETVFGDEDYLPPIHFREKGDVRLLLAETYMHLGNPAQAVAEMEKAYRYEKDLRPQFMDDKMVETPLLRDVGYTFYWHHRTDKGYLEQLWLALREERFAPMLAYPDYQKLLSQVEETYKQA